MVVRPIDRLDRSQSREVPPPTKDSQRPGTGSEGRLGERSFALVVMVTENPSSRTSTVIDSRVASKTVL